MAITPYTPTPFATPVANPAIGGTGTPLPYVSVSEYQFAPTAVDTTSLVPTGSAEDQLQSLADTIRRASGWADRIVFGADPAAKGASLCATLSVESAYVPVLKGQLRLVCDYKPIIQVNGIDVGPSMSTLQSIGNNIAQNVSIGRRTIYVPVLNFSVRQNDLGNPNPYVGTIGKYQAVWSYVNGYPHTMLADAAIAGTSTVVVQPTDGGTGLLGVIPNVTQMTIVDGSYTEQFLITAVSGTTLTTAVPLQFDHHLPVGPDSIPVTTLPSDVSLAVIYLTTVLIKTQGDAALVLDEMREPRRIRQVIGDQFEDFNMAAKLLHPFRVRIKQKV